MKKIILFASLVLLASMLYVQKTYAADDFHCCDPCQDFQAADTITADQKCRDKGCPGGSFAGKCSVETAIYHCCTPCRETIQAQADAADRVCQGWCVLPAQLGTCESSVMADYHCCDPCRSVEHADQTIANGVCQPACNQNAQSGLCPASCATQYPTGKGSGVCMAKDQCVPRADWNNNAAVSAVPGQALCERSDFICCIYTNEGSGAAASGSGVNTAGKTADQLRSAAASQLNPAKFTAPTDLIKRVISLMMAFIGSIALVLFIWAGILWMTAAGEEKKIDSAKKIIVWTSLGVLVMLLSYTLVNFVIKAIK